MIDDDLSPELEQLFTAEREREAPPPAAKDRVRHALALSIPSFADVGSGTLLDPTAAGAAANGAIGAEATATAATSSAAAVAGGTATAGATVTGGSALGKGLAVALVAAMAGTAGTGIYLAQGEENPRQERVLVVEDARIDPKIDPSVLLPKDVPKPIVVEKPAQKPIAKPAPILAPAPSAPPEEETPEQRAERLRIERAILDDARGAIARGDGGAALIAIDAHRARFPDGQLVEEREALTILALARLARHEEAKRKADAFKARWPTSLFAPAVGAAARSGDSTR